VLVYVRSGHRVLAVFGWLNAQRGKEKAMDLTKLIDLIAEVAAKRVAREGKTKAETPDGASRGFRTILASIWSAGHILFGVLRFMRDLDTRRCSDTF
jgi:hypothetical protein